MLIQILLLVVALATVVKSADWFLGAAEKVGIHLHLPPFILGVILVGFGTSLPELATSMAAVADGVNTVTIPNVAGSNIANVLLILGVSTIALGTLKFKKNIIDLDIPLLIGVTALFSILIVDGSLNRIDGLILLFGFLGYMIYSLGYKEEDDEHQKGLLKLIAVLARNNGKSNNVTNKYKKLSPITYIIMIGSIILLGFGSKIAVDSILNIVEEVNIGVAVISFFALAIGTSLPELVVSFKALRKGQGDLVAGNIIGSCMFNILLIAGLTSLIKVQEIDIALVPWMIVGLVLSTILIMAGSISKRIHIWEGFVYVLIYMAISSYIVQV
jgi:cation:H+ antiporter